MRGQWEDELARSGLGFVQAKPQDGEALPGAVTCPACGTTAMLVDGACSDCGLMLG
jgi:hypothetical protein